MTVTNRIKVCCPGYQRIGRKCIPVCQQTCENSKCTGPETCTCNDGYVHFHAYR